MDRKRIINELRRAKQLKAECPECGSEFTLAKALIFDAIGDLPKEAVQVIDKTQDELRGQAADLKEQEAELRRRKRSATDAAERKAMEVSLGLVVEKIVTGWKAFPHEPFDCRSLFEPIDYVAFDGMTKKGKIDSFSFIDVKTGRGRLNKHQRMIREAVTDCRLDYREV